jgi:hypothetical protein
VCGNGLVETGEQCDGTPTYEQCPLFPEDLGCFPATHPKKCKCCTNGYGCGGYEGPDCCDPEATCQLFQLFPSPVGTCYDATCGPDDECGAGLTCVDGTCCNANVGAICAIAITGAYVPCCPPAQCCPIEGGEAGRCCIPGG